MRWALVGSVWRAREHLPGKKWAQERDDTFESRAPKFPPRWLVLAGGPHTEARTVTETRGRHAANRQQRGSKQAAKRQRELASWPRVSGERTDNSLWLARPNGHEHTDCERAWKNLQANLESNWICAGGPTHKHKHKHKRGASFAVGPPEEHTH